MKEALFAGAMLGIALSWIARAAKNPDGFIRHFSRGAFMRDLNEKMEEKTLNSDHQHRTSQAR
jgi:hypothetical protein